MPIPPDSDPRKRRITKAATAAASSGSSQVEDSRAVAETPTQQKSTTDESRMDVEGEETDESRRSTAPNTRRRIATKTSLEENESGKTTVAVTTQESLDGIREKAMRIASLDGLETGSAERWSIPRGAANGKTKKGNELVRALEGQITKEVDIVVASVGKTKLWRDLSLMRTVRNRNMKCSDIARSPGSALRVFTSSERLPSQLKFNEIGEVGKLVKKIHTNDPKVGKVWKSVIFGPEEPTKLEHDAMLASW